MTRAAWLQYDREEEALEHGYTLGDLPPCLADLCESAADTTSQPTPEGLYLLEALRGRLRAAKSDPGNHSNEPCPRLLRPGRQAVYSTALGRVKVLGLLPLALPARDTGR